MHDTFCNKFYKGVSNFDKLGTGARTPTETGLAQLVEHWSPKPGVGSSSLSTRANCKYCYDSICERLI